MFDDVDDDDDVSTDYASSLMCSVYVLLGIDNE